MNSGSPIVPPIREEWGLTVRLPASTRACTLVPFPLRACHSHGELSTSLEARACREIIFVQHKGANSSTSPRPRCSSRSRHGMQKFRSLFGSPNSVPEIHELQMLLHCFGANCLRHHVGGILFPKHFRLSQVSFLHTFLNPQTLDIDVPAPSTNAFSTSSPNRSSRIGPNDSF